MRPGPSTAASLLHGTAVAAGCLSFVGEAAPSHWLAVAVGVATGALWLPAARLGPRNMLRLVLLAWAVLLAVAAVWPFLELAAGAFVVHGVVLGAVLSGSTVMEQRRGFLDMAAVGAVVAAVLLAAVSAAWLVPLLGLAAAVAAHRMLRHVRDPVRRDDPVRRLAPWGDGSGRRRPRGTEWLLRAPAVPLFLVVSWLLFLPWAERRGGWWVVPRPLLEPYAYAIPDLATAPLRAFLSLLTAPWVNQTHIQIVYVSVLLLLFGLPFEAKEGPRRTLAIFFLASFAGGVVAGGLLFVLLPLDGPVLDEAWQRIWTGGSAGAFGLMGAVAARAPRPWPLLGFFAFWELNVGWFFLQSYTPAFHVTALAAGFLAARCWWTPARERGPARRRSRLQA